MNKVRSFMMDMIIMLTAAAVVAVYTYGLRALWSILLSIAAAVMTEIAGYILFMKRNPTKIADFSAVFTGLAVALAMPSSAPFWVAPVGAVFAIAVAKLPFGDSTSQPFVPAAAGIAFVTLSFPSLVFSYPNLSIGKLTTVSTAEGFVPGTSLGTMLSQSRSIGTNLLNVLDILVGRIPGPMGATCLILMFGTFLYLVIRRQPGALTVFSYLVVCSAIAFFFPRIMTGRGYSVLMELGAGLLFYSAVFFLSDPATSPKTKGGRLLYGAVAGALTMIMRRIGTYEESVVFVVLIMNAISDVFDGIAGVSFGKKTAEKDEKKDRRAARKQEIVPAAASVQESDSGSTAPVFTTPAFAGIPLAETGPAAEPYAVPQGATFADLQPSGFGQHSPEPAFAAELVEQLEREEEERKKDENPEITAEVEALLASILESNSREKESSPGETVTGQEGGGSDE